MKKYNSEFKSMIVELYKTGRAVKDLSREYGVSEVTIYKWVPCPNVNNLRKNESLNFKKTSIKMADKMHEYLTLS